MFWFFGHETCGILASQPGIKPAPPALEDEVLATGLAGKPQAFTLGACMLSTLYPLLRLSALDHSRTETQLSLGLIPRKGIQGNNLAGEIHNIT